MSVPSSSVSFAMLTPGWPSDERAQAINEHLRPYGATLIRYRDPGTRKRRCWVEHPNDGQAEQRARQMVKDLERAGLYPLVPGQR